jgi:hypothetical protein
MVSLSFIFFLNVLIFGIIGALRRWEKETLVSFSVILGLFVIYLVESYIPVLRTFFKQNGVLQFWIRTLILIVIVIFGYLTTNAPIFKRHDDKERSDESKVPRFLLGFFLGLLNGYLILGTLWYFLDLSNYPFPIISAPSPNDPVTSFGYSIIKSLPPYWLKPPLLFFVFAIFAVLIIAVFI